MGVLADVSIHYVKPFNTATFKPHFTDTRLIQTPHYYGQFALSLGKKSPYIFSKLNPLNTDIPLIWTLSFFAPLSVCINGA